MLSPEKIKVGIIGFGKRGILHASMVNINPKAEWKAACEIDKSLLTFMKNFYPDIPFFSDAEEMLNNVGLNTIFICTPDSTHLPLALQLVKKDLNIFVENPLAESFASCKQMVNMTAERKYIFSVGYYSSFKVLFQQAKTLFEGNILNKVKRYRASLQYTLPRFANPNRKVITSTASSFLYLIYWLFGPVKSLYAKAAGRFPAIASGASLILDHSSGLMGVIDMSWNRPGFPLPTVKIAAEATGGTLEISDDSLKFYLYKKKGGFEKGWTTIHRADIPAPSRFFLCEEGYYEANSSFLNSCREKKKSLVGWEDGLEIMRILEAAELSIDTNRAIFLNEVK